MPVRFPFRSNRVGQPPNQMASTTDASPPPSSKLQEIIPGSDRLEELSDTDNEYEDMGTITSEHETANIAYVNSIISPLRDSLVTPSSEVQDETLEIVLPFLEGNPNDFPLNTFGLPKLQKEKHAAFLRQCLGNYPAPMQQMDAARPWLVYWSLQGLTAMGFDISEYRER